MKKLLNEVKQEIYIDDASYNMEEDFFYICRRYCKEQCPFQTIPSFFDSVLDRHYIQFPITVTKVQKEFSFGIIEFITADKGRVMLELHFSGNPNNFNTLVYVIENESYTVKTEGIGTRPTVKKVTFNITKLKDEDLKCLLDYEKTTRNILVVEFKKDNRIISFEIGKRGETRKKIIEKLYDPDVFLGEFSAKEIYRKHEISNTRIFELVDGKNILKSSYLLTEGGLVSEYAETFKNNFTIRVYAFKLFGTPEAYKLWKCYLNDDFCMQCYLKDFKREALVFNYNEDELIIEIPKGKFLDNNFNFVFDDAREFLKNNLNRFLDEVQGMAVFDGIISGEPKDMSRVTYWF